MRVVLITLFAFFATAALSEEPQTLMWQDLLPEGEEERLEELYASGPGVPFGHSESSPMMGPAPVQIGTFNVVDELDGQLVRVPGFVLPFEYSSSGNISEFLLVPYFGACIHTPPPPPNQMVYVKSEKPTNIGKVWSAVWAIGILRAEPNYNDLGNAAYTLELQSWEEYDG